MRKKSVILNYSAQLISNILSVFLTLFTRKIFIDYLGIEMLGLSGLFASIFSILSITELGLGHSMFSFLIESISTNNIERTIAINKLFSKYYVRIGITIFSFGLLISPLLPFFIKNVSLGINIYFVYFLLLFDTSTQYLLSHRRMIFSADQKEYINSNIETLFRFVYIIPQVIVIMVFKNYYYLLIVNIVINFAKNISLFIYSKKKYPYLNKKSNYILEPEFYSKLYQNTLALLMSNVSSLMVFSTDNILLSSFVSLSIVGIYSTYNQILIMVNSIFNNIIFSMKASVGNFLIENDINSAYDLFSNIFFINFIIMSFTSTTIFLVANDFVNIWIGEKYIFSSFILFILVFNNYTRHILSTHAIFIAASGQFNPFKNYRYFTLLEGVSNLVIAFIFLKFFNLKETGIFMATSLSTIVSTIILPLNTFKFLFHKSLKNYFTTYFEYFIIFIIIMFISRTLYLTLDFLNLYVKIVFGILISITINFLIITIRFRRRDVFIYFMNLSYKMFLRVFKRA